MTTNPYKVGEKFSGGVNKVADVFGAASDVSYPGGAIHQAHANYRVNKYVNKHYMPGEAQASQNASKAAQHQKQMNTAQGHASQMQYGKNGITAENGYFKDKDGKIRYDRSKDKSKKK